MTKNLADMEIPVKFFNYKIFKGEKEFTLKNSYVYFISGPNNIGKTSFKDVFAMIQTGKNSVDEPVTRGETEGFIETKIPGADGRMYLIRHDFTDDKHNKFVAIDEDGKKISSVGEFRKIFQYTHFTAEEFFLWTDSADGRKKQKKIILNLLGTEDLMKYEILEQDELVEYEERTQKGHEKDQLVKLCQSGRLTEEEQERVNSLQDTKNKLIEVTNKLSNIQAVSVTRTSLTDKNADLGIRVSNMAGEIKDDVDEYNADLEKYNKDIAEYDEKLRTARAAREQMQKIYPEVKKSKEDKLATMKEEITNNTDELSKLPNEGSSELTQQKVNLDAEIDHVNLINARVVNIKENTEKRDTAIRDYEDLTRKVDRIRDQKKKLIASADLGVKNISIEEDHVKLDGFEFKENQVSKSQAINIIARLMCAINASPIQVIGSANDLDWEVLDKLDALAREQGKIMILDQVDRDSTDIAVVGYEPKGSLTTDKVGPPASHRGESAGQKSDTAPGSKPPPDPEEGRDPAPPEAPVMPL